MLQMFYYNVRSISVIKFYTFSAWISDKGLGPIRYI